MYYGYEGKNCDKCNKFYKKINDKCILNTNLSEICSLPDYGYSITDNKYGTCLSCPKNNYGLTCSNHGYCNGKGTVFGDGKCNCFQNYTQDLCENEGLKLIKLCVIIISDNGICLLFDNNYNCNCKKNYTGIDCNNCLVGYIKK